MDNTFWATVALVLFIGVIVYFKVPAMLTKSLDERANRIKGELEEASRLREEAQMLLREYQEKRKQAEKDAADMVAAAKREAEALLEEAHRKSEDYVTRRTALAEQKIAQAEREAINEVRSTAVDIAIEAARKVLAERSDEKIGADMFRTSIEAVKSKLN